MSIITSFFKSTITRREKAIGDFGYHELIHKDPSLTNIVDLVAIHGLDGHYAKSWTDKHTGVNWLKDLIPMGFFRVLSFSYNSSVKFSKSICDLYDFADQLLEGLHASRQSEEEKQRPIIFVCHSFGGIVFKQAYIRSYEVERYHDIGKLTQRVLFFGTPHRGSSLASWGTILSSILKTASLGTSTNTQLPRDLEPYSRDLDRISQSFKAKSSNIKIYSFFETEKMDFMTNVIVCRESAILGDPNETTIPMSGNHCTICRFTRNDEARFKYVSSILKNVVKCMETNTSNGILESDRKMLMDNLSSTNYTQHKDRNPEPVQGTCVWILQDSEYRGWLESEQSFLLWVSADPGCGKSVLASYLIGNRMGKEGLAEKDICYFFFKSDNYDQRSGFIALQSLLKQLCAKRPKIIPLVADLLHNQSFEDLRALWSTLVAAIQQMQVTDGKAYCQVFCVLDGLDECDEARKLVHLISETFASSDISTTGDGTSNGSLKLLVLSRPDNFIKNGFDKHPSIRQHGSTRHTAMIRLRGEDQTDAISADISRVVDATISSLVQHGLPDEFLDNVKEQLIRRADRTFLWVTLIIQLLAAKADTGASRRDLDQILNSRDIDAIYAEMLASRCQDSKARKMLGIILAAIRPLTISEMSIALAITPDHNPFEVDRPPLRPKGNTFSDIEYNLVQPFETHIKSICGNFVRIIQNKVYLIHETAREFLLEVSNSDIDGEYYSSTPQDADPFQNWYFPLGEPEPLAAVTTKPTATVGPWQNSFSIPTCEALVLHICTTYLYMLGIQCAREDVQHHTNSNGDFLEYASMFWHRHFGAIQDRIAPRDVRYYENLCHPKFPGFTTWITVLCGDVRMRQAEVGRSIDELQDYYIELLDIQIHCHSPDHANMEFGCYDLDIGRRDKDWDIPLHSTNPGTLRNCRFHTAADKTGFVSMVGRRKEDRKRIQKDLKE